MSKEQEKFKIGDEVYCVSKFQTKELEEELYQARKFRISEIKQTQNKSELFVLSVYIRGWTYEIERDRSDMFENINDAIELEMRLNYPILKEKFERVTELEKRIEKITDWISKF